jgi:hypothetical protein
VAPCATSCPGLLLVGSAFADLGYAHDPARPDDAARLGPVASVLRCADPSFDLPFPVSGMSGVRWLPAN